MNLPIFILVAAILLAGCGKNDAATQTQSTRQLDFSMTANLVAKGSLIVGKKLVVEGPSPSTDYLTVFEDDGDTGYFYGLDTTRKGNPIVDALHIYNAKGGTDRDKPSTVKIVWSSDGLKSALLIDDYPHAVFDFQAKRGYCRTGFPPPDKSWTDHSHGWDDAAIELFR